MTQMFTRRQLIQGGALLGVAGALAPTFLWRARVARGGSQGAPASTSTTSTNRSLVIIQMAGGNDGLNMVAPYNDGTYASVRPTIKLDPASVLQLNDSLGLNPQMTSLKKVWDAGNLAVLEGVGYPNPTYSHFDSQTIWYTAAPKGEFSDGWLGRFFKQTGAESNVEFGGIDIGAGLAPPFTTSGVTIPVVSNPAAY